MELNRLTVTACFLLGMILRVTPGIKAVNWFIDHNLYVIAILSLLIIHIHQQEYIQHSIEKEEPVYKHRLYWQYHPSCTCFTSIPPPCHRRQSQWKSYSHQSLYQLPTQAGLYHTLCRVLTSNLQAFCVWWSIAMQDSTIALLTLHDYIIRTV